MLNGISGHLTVYIHSYVELTFTQGLTSAKLITHYMKTHYGNYTSNIRPSLIFLVLSLLPTYSVASPEPKPLFHVLSLSVGGPTVLALST